MGLGSPSNIGHCPGVSPQASRELSSIVEAETRLRNSWPCPWMVGLAIPLHTPCSPQPCVSSSTDYFLHKQVWEWRKGRKGPVQPMAIITYPTREENTKNVNLRGQLKRAWGDNWASKVWSPRNVTFMHTSIHLSIPPLLPLSTHPSIHPSLTHLSIHPLIRHPTHMLRGDSNLWRPKGSHQSLANVQGWLQPPGEGTK
jgi:hypothetical protein